MEVIRRRYVWALRVNVSDPSPWVTVFGPFECHEKPYANIIQKGIIFSMKGLSMRFHMEKLPMRSHVEILRMRSHMETLPTRRHLMLR